MEEAIILALLLCMMLYIIGWVSKIWPVSFIGSAGWIVVALRLFEAEEDFLVLGLMISIALAMVICTRDHEVGRWQWNSQSRG